MTKRDKPGLFLVPKQQRVSQLKLEFDKPVSRTEFGQLLGVDIDDPEISEIITGILERSEMRMRRRNKAKVS